MTGFNHTLAGCIIATTIPAPAAPIVAFASHFVLDAMPHMGNHPAFTSEPKLSKPLKILIVFDGLASAAIYILWAFVRPELVFISLVAVFFSLLPDLMWIFKHWLHTPKWFIRFGNWIQWGEFPWGWWLELIYATLMIYVLIILS